MSDSVPLTSGSRTDIGRVRTNNEDNLLVSAPLFAVADGMGGHAAGEVASEIAVRTLEQCNIAHPDADLLRAAVVKANEAIIEGYHVGLGRPGMGTTLTAAVIEDDHLLIAQVGDSRAYLLRNGRLRQLTIDHSYVNELVAIGEITEEEAAVHPKRSIITRALGNDANTAPDLFEHELLVGDRLLLCSDGLSGMVGDRQIEAVLTRLVNPQDAADSLIAQARANGGSDNITAIVIDINALRPSSAEQAAQDADGRIKSGPGRLRKGVIAFILGFLLLVGAAVGGEYLYASNSYFLRLDGGYVCVYRGLPGDIMPGLRLQWLERSTDVAAADISPTVAQRLAEGWQVPGLGKDAEMEAAALIEEYRAWGLEHASSEGAGQ